MPLLYGASSSLPRGSFTPQLRASVADGLEDGFRGRFTLLSPGSSSTRSSTPCASLSDDDFDSVISSTLTDHIPSLTRGNSIASTNGAAQTEIASMLHGGYVLESEDGILSIPQRYDPDADLLCPFQILDCDETFSDVVDFKVHVFSHFRGHPLPSFASCFLCDAKFEQTPEDDHALAWNNVLTHMIYEHFRRGQQLATIRTDFTLMRWMYDRRIISDHHFKRTQMCPIPTVLPAANGGGSEIVNLPRAPSPPPMRYPTVSDSSLPTRAAQLQNRPYVMVAGRRAERRSMDRTRPFPVRFARTMT